MNMGPNSTSDRAGAADGSGTPGSGRLVLVVDDDPVNRELMTIRLRDAGFAVETSDSGEAALPKALASRPDAVLSDIQMPGMDGFELRRAFRRDARLARIPVVLVSSALVEERARRSGEEFDGHCVVRSSDLHEAIAALAEALGPLMA